MSFVHLRLHTEYSITDGIVRVEPPKRKGGGTGDTLVSRAAQLGMPAVSVTDTNNMFAMLKVYKSAEPAGVKPIVGADLWVRRPSGQIDRLTVLVQDQQGYRRLSELMSRAYLEFESGHQPHDKPAIRAEWLEGGTGGLIALTGRGGPVFEHAIEGDGEQAEAALSQLRALFGDRLYLEVARCDRAGDEEWVQAAALLSRIYAVPLVATNDVRFLDQADFEAHEARVCIAQGVLLSDDKRTRDYTPEQYLKTTGQMQQLFADLPEAISNTLVVARRCNIEFEFGKNHLPDFPVPTDQSVTEYLASQAREGLAARLLEAPASTSDEEYQQRLEYEIAVIQKMGFSGYFLVVSDFIRWSKANGVPVGPGRGSGAGSLVAYALRITDLDPIPYNLLFERFLNPDRVSLPDFDVDFCQAGRDRVIDYVSKKYGSTHVGQIITYNTMAARGVIRDVCRVMGYGYGFGDSIARLIPNTPGATLHDALEESAELRVRYETEEDTRSVIDMAQSLEGMTRGVGVHAGGVVIAPKQLTEFAPIYCDPGAQSVRTQFDMKDLETVGLVKFDFLGLKTLTIIQGALDNIQQRHGLVPDLQRISLTDTKTYELYASGATNAVFQMESPGMQRASVDLGPDRFEDLIALISLYRPGPMELIPDYVRRKRGDEQVTYLHPKMEESLAPTFGVFVYQEQVMQVAQKLAGYSLGGADLLRRAMGKKKPEEMAKQRSVFQNGAADNGIDGDTATAVFDLMEKFANYGFNKSHAAAYALVSYQTAYLKTHYPAEFMASVLSCDMDKVDELALIVKEVRRMGIKLERPDINRSGVGFSVEPDGAIRYGLAAIRGIGESAVLPLLEARANRPFKDLIDLSERIDTRKVSKRTLEVLVAAGALDDLAPNRQTLLDAIPTVVGLAERARQAEETGQGDLFGGGAQAAAAPPAIKVVPEMPKLKRLTDEFQVLGTFVSGHPLDVYYPIARQISSGTIAMLSEEARQRSGRSQTSQMFCGVVSELRSFPGDRVLVTFSDRTAEVGAWMDVAEYRRVGFLKLGAVAFVAGQFSYRPGQDGRSGQVRLHEAYISRPAEVMAAHVKELEIDFRGYSRTSAEVGAELARFASPDHGVRIRFVEDRAVIPRTSKLRFEVSPDSLYFLKNLVGADRVKLRFEPFKEPTQEPYYAETMEQMNYG